MKKMVCACFLIVVAELCASAAPNTSTDESRLSYFIEPVLQKGLGGIAYDLSANAGGGNSYLSRLEFPQIPLEAGIVVGAAMERGGKRQWLIEAGFSHSTLPLTGTMTDSDWVLIPPYPKMLFSYSESNDATVSWRASLEAAWTFASSGAWSISLYAAYRYQSLSHVENTLIGWGWDPTLLPNPTVGSNASSASDILEYTLTAHEPGLGLMADVQVLTGLSLELRAAFTPVYVSDVDDHKLRSKLSTAEGWGAGLYADFRGKYQFPQYYKGFPPILL